MFKNIYFKNNFGQLGYYVIIDDDIRETSKEPTAFEAIISIYSKRSLNVSKNLFLYFKYTTFHICVITQCTVFTSIHT